MRNEEINHSSVSAYSMAFNLNESYGAGMRKIIELNTVYKKWAVF